MMNFRTSTQSRTAFDLVTAKSVYHARSMGQEWKGSNKFFQNHSIPTESYISRLHED